MTNIEKIIDSHIHIFPPERMKGAIRWVKRFIPSLPFDHTLSEEDILAHLEESRISLFFNYVYPLRPQETRELNHFNYMLSERVPRAICFGSLHPENDRKGEIIEEALFDFGLAGLKFHPFVQGFHPLDSRMNEVYSKMSDLQKPVILHTGFDFFYGQRITAKEIEVLLSGFPKLPFVLCHMLYPDLRGAFRILENYQNVILDGSNVFSGFQQKINETSQSQNIFSGRREVIKGEEIYRVHFYISLKNLEKYSNRILFGTDYPVCMNSLEEIYRYMDGLEISDQAKNDIMFNTAFQFAKRFSPKIKEINEDDL